MSIPAVVGMAGDEAKDALEAAGFDVEFDAGEDFVVLAGNWTVDAQTPEAEASAPEGSTVTLKVSKPEPTAEAAPAEPAPAEPAPAAPAVEATPSGLTSGWATTACDNYGDAAYPYGFNGDWLIDGLAMEIQGDEWFLKAGASITNQFNAEGRFVVECRVGGTDGAPLVTSWIAY